MSCFKQFLNLKTHVDAVLGGVGSYVFSKLLHGRIGFIQNVQLLPSIAFGYVTQIMMYTVVDTLTVLPNTSTKMLLPLRVPAKILTGMLSKVDTAVSYILNIKTFSATIGRHDHNTRFLEIFRDLIVMQAADLGIRLLSHKITTVLVGSCMLVSYKFIVIAALMHTLCSTILLVSAAAIKYYISSSAQPQTA